MSPGQRAQFLARIEKVAADRATQAIDASVTIKRVVRKLTPLRDLPPATQQKLVDGYNKLMGKPVTDAKTGNGREAKKQAAYRQRKGDELKAGEAKRKRDARAAKKVAK